MITGELPFAGPNFLAQKQGMHYKPAVQKIAGLPSGVDEVIRKALAPDPAARFTSAKELVAALKGT